MNVDIAGRPTPEELAAVLAVLRARRDNLPAVPTGYERWRAQRLATIRP